MRVLFLLKKSDITQKAVEFSKITVVMNKKLIFCDIESGLGNDLPVIHE